MIRIGYACINIELKSRGIYSTRTITIGQLKKRPDDAKKIALLNIDDLGKMIEHNESLGIRFFRITSNLFPHLGNPKTPAYTIDFARKELARVGKIARELGHRITMHPGQYAQLGSTRPEVVKQTTIDLTNHADIFVAMGMTPTLGSVMIIHGGGTFGDKVETLKRFRENFLKLPEYVRKFVSLENDEWSYSVMDLLPVCEDMNIPLCPDFFHHAIGHADQFDIYDHAVMSRIISTWTRRGIKPKCHLSEQRPGERKGAHSDCVSEIPRRLIDVAIEYGIDIMLEVKHKDTCVISIYEKYFTQVNNGNRVEWYLHLFK